MDHLTAYLVFQHGGLDCESVHAFAQTSQYVRKLLEKELKSATNAPGGAKLVCGLMHGVEAVVVMPVLTVKFHDFGKLMKTTQFIIAGSHSVSMRVTRPHEIGITYIMYANLTNGIKSLMLTCGYRDLEVVIRANYSQRQLEVVDGGLKLRYTSHRDYPDDVCCYTSGVPVYALRPLTDGTASDREKLMAF